MAQLFALIHSFRTEDHGQGLAEYALILSLIALVCVIGLIFTLIGFLAPTAVHLF